MKNILRTFILFSFYVVCAQAQVTKITADFSKWEEYPLVKKIGVYQTPLVTQNWLQRDMPKMAELEARSFRYELAWGKDLYTSSDITGSSSDIKYNWQKANFLFNRAIQHAPAIIFCHGYLPLPLQNGSGGLAWQAPPTNYNLWKDVNRTAAENWKSMGYSNRYVEVWNEPDLPGGFFSGTVEDYVKIYQYAALGAKEGDPDAKVGGPGGALQWWHDPLVNHCMAYNLPLDFISGHAYGTDFNWQLDAMRNAINKLGNRQAEMLLTEYSPYPAAEYAANGPVERAEAAMTFFQAVPTMLQYTDLSYVTWAQYIDPEDGTSGKAFSNWDKLGLIDGNYGFRKALFNAFKLYGMMPADRANVTLPNNSPLGSMASTSDDCSALVMWNPTDNEHTIQASLRGLPIKEGRLQVYNIDETVNSWYETGDDRLVPSVDCDTTVSSLGVLTLRNLKLRPKGVLFVRFQAKDAAPLFPQNDFARIIRTDQYYETTRNNNNPYAYFDSKTWTAMLSTCGKATGTAMVSVTAEDLPENIRVTSKSTKLSDRNDYSAQAIRFDFMGNDGKYRKSVVFHGDIYHEDNHPAIPWGSKTAPTQVVKVDDIKDFSFQLSQYAPSSFSGRVIITFILAQTGVNTKCNFQLHRQQEFLLGNVQADEVSTNSMQLYVKSTGSSENVEKVGFMTILNGDPLHLNNPKITDAELDNNCIYLDLKSLQSNKAYHIRGFAVMNNGDSIITPEAVIHTLAAPCNISLRDVNCDTIALTAKLVGNVVSAPSTVYKRGFVWSKQEDNAVPDFSNNVIVSSTAGTGTFSGQLANLAPATIYAVRSFAFSRAGVSFSKTKYFSTNPFATGIKDVAISETTPVEIYDLNGRRVNDLSTGVFMVKYSDGRIRKVFSHHE